MITATRYQNLTHTSATARVGCAILVSVIPRLGQTCFRRSHPSWTQTIQTFDTDIEVGNNPVVPSSGGTNLGMKQTVGKYMQTFDPTLALNGNIVGKYRFRIGVSYSTHTAAAISRGEVLIEFSVKYA